MKFTLEIELGEIGMKTSADVLDAIKRSLGPLSFDATVAPGQTFSRHAIHSTYGQSVGIWEVK